MPTAVSAPGKVLLAGGYLVLDRAYTALVFGLSARIHVLVHAVAEQGEATPENAPEIVVQSPQFRDALWTYAYQMAAERGGVAVTQVQGTSSSTASRNPFVETALTYALTYISTLRGIPTKPARITILADNDYYSNTPVSKPTPAQPFPSFGVSLQEAHKTGLGSSAALVTAITGALLVHYLPPFSITAEENKAKLHNLAQAAHCAAQGKVGSGFDIATAVFGTCVYRRFSPAILSAVGEPGSKDFAARVKDLVDDPGKKWDVEISKGGVTIPKGMALVMCDVDCGSATVGMVRKVLEWKKSDPEGSKELMAELQICNELLADLLRGDGHQGGACMLELGEAFVAIRAIIREMGERSGVPIEPEGQTALLDAVTRSVRGVAGGVVPGAGGYDAIVLLVQADETTMSELKDFLKTWSKDKDAKIKLLDAKGELEGARVEDLGRYGDAAAN